MKAFRPTERMLDILARLMQCPLTTDQIFLISQAFKKPYTHKQNLRTDLLKLLHAGVVNRQELLSPGAGQNMLYYYLKPAALDLLYEPDTAQEFKKIEALFTPVALGNQSHQFNLVSEFLVKFELSLHRLGGAITHFTRENFFIIRTKDRMIKPDGTIIIKTKNGLEHLFFLECETGSNRLKTVRYKRGVFVGKIEVYTAHRNAAGWRQDFPEHNLNGFRVLVVSDSDEKITSRLALAQRMKKRDLFQFATIQALSNAGNILTEPLWSTPIGRRVLLPENEQV